MFPALLRLRCKFGSGTSSAFEGELLAVVQASHAYRVYFLSRHFTLPTAHKAVAAIFNNAMSVPSRVTKRVLVLETIDFPIELIISKENLAAQSLSRFGWSLPMRKLEESDNFWKCSLQQRTLLVR